jgi:hypothetical protein
MPVWGVRLATFVLSNLLDDRTTGVPDDAGAFGSLAPCPRTCCGTFICDAAPLCVLVLVPLTGAAFAAVLDWARLDVDAFDMIGFPFE